MLGFFAIDIYPLLPQAGAEDLVGDLVGYNQDDEVYNVVHQADGRGEAVLLAYKAYFVHVGGDNFGRVYVQVVLHQEHFLIAHVHNVAAAHNEQDYHGGHDGRNVYMPYPLQDICAVDGCRFVELRAYAGQCRDIDYGAVAHALPDARPHVHVREQIGDAHEVDGLAAASLNHGIDKARAGGEEQIHHGHQYDGGNEVGHVCNGLGELLKAEVLNVVQDDGQADGEGEAGNQTVDGNHQSVLDYLDTPGGGEELEEPFKAYPVAAPDAFAGPVVLKSDLQAIERAVHEQYDKDYRRDKEKVELVVLLYEFNSFFALFLLISQLQRGYVAGLFFGSHRAIPPCDMDKSHRPSAARLLDNWLKIVNDLCL